MKQNKKARIIAFYLPQYHPIPENDKWWEPGFTEWTNVRKAKPLFKGHRQPCFPANKNFYNLLDPQVRQAQADLAVKYGVEGFCYWHYWFGGKRLLERPFNEVLESGRPDFPFCLAWANESWTGIWHGAPERMLMEQVYPGLEDIKSHFNYCVRAFKDPRYMKIEGKPIFVIYRPRRILNRLEFTSEWQKLARANGLPGIYFMACGNWDEDPAAFDMQGVLVANTPINQIKTEENFLDRLCKKLTGKNAGYFYSKITNRPAVYSYAKMVRKPVRSLSLDYQQYPVILPNWDNTPRCGKRGIVFQGAAPELFRELIRKTLKQVSGKRPEHRIVFVKSWNEWAEGNYLEADETFGEDYLRVIKEELDGENR